MSFSFISYFQGWFRILEKSSLSWTSNFEDDWANYPANESDLLSYLYENSLLRSSRGYLANRQKPPELIFASLFLLWLVHLLRVHTNFFASCFQRAVPSWRSCSSFVFTHKEADWLWRPAEDALRRTHPAATQGRLKDCSRSSTGFTNDANRCPRCIMFSLPRNLAPRARRLHVKPERSRCWQWVNLLLELPCTLQAWSRGRSNGFWAIDQPAML